MRRAEFDTTFQSSSVAFDPTSGYPVGESLFYECGLCRDVLPSAPPDSEVCTCGNLYIDVDAGRIGARRGDETLSLLRAQRRLQ
jgi:hypothetical protein